MQTLGELCPAVLRGIERGHRGLCFSCLSQVRANTLHVFNDLKHSLYLGRTHFVQRSTFFTS